LADFLKSSPLAPLGEMTQKIDDGCQVMAKAHIAFGKVS
jgi:hypothetical protein